jgi:FMN-dependent NADH-azoreductase
MTNIESIDIEGVGYGPEAAQKAVDGGFKRAQEAASALAVAA